MYNSVEESGVYLPVKIAMILSSFVIGLFALGFFGGLGTAAAGVLLVLLLSVLVDNSVPAVLFFGGADVAASVVFFVVVAKVDSDLDFAFSSCVFLTVESVVDFFFVG